MKNKNNQRGKQKKINPPAPAQDAAFQAPKKNANPLTFGDDH